MKEKAQIFLCYAREDQIKVEDLYQRLVNEGFKPWMDKKGILPGEKWELSIQKAIRQSDFFLTCLSANSINKRGVLQKEINDALAVWREMLDSDIYLIPVRLEKCKVPDSLRDFQWVNLFEEDGWAKLVKALQIGIERRAGADSSLVQDSEQLQTYPKRKKSPLFQRKALLALAGNKKWFELISKSHLPVLMTESTKDLWNVVIVLSKAWPFAKDKVLELIKKHWLPDKSNDLSIWSTMEGLESWDEETVQVICELIGRSEIDDRRVMFLATDVALSAPELAPRIIAAALNKKLATENSLEPRLMESSSWHELPKLADAAPRAFLITLWPWFLDVLTRISTKPPLSSVSYRPDSSLATDLATDKDSRREFPLVSSIEHAITKLAEENPNEFLEFLRSWQKTDLLTAQRLLARGLSKIAKTHSTECLQFLLDDPRRLALGNYHNVHRDSQTLIKAVVPYLSESQIRQLEQAVMHWNRYRETQDETDAKLQQHRYKWNREHRLRLLKVFPVESLSPDVQKFIRDEERALPNYQDWDIKDTGFQTVGSPMSSDQMAKAKDEHILNLFNELDDSTTWDHPRDLMKGGSIQAAREFAKLAKEHPEKAIFLINQLTPGRQERPVGHAIEALAETDYPWEAFLDLIIDLDRRGFKSEEFRTNVASALGKKVKEQKGLPDSICTLLENWLTEPWQIEEIKTNEDDIKNDSVWEKENNKYNSILWGYGGIELIPQGTYTVLETLTHAYLLKRPMETDRWLKLLQNHLNRPESSKVWHTLAHQLKYLVHCDHDQATNFLKALFDKYPNVRDSKNGAILIAHMQSWIPEEVVRQFIYSIRDSNWKYGPQAFAEILLLRRTFFPNEQWSSKEVEKLLSNQSTDANDIGKMRTGLAYAAANLWGDVKSRKLVTDVLITLIPLASEEASHAIMDVLRVTDSLYSDEETYRLLETLIRHPSTMKNAGKEFLVDKIQDLLPANPNLVFRVCQTLVDVMRDELIDMSSSFAASAPILVDISFRLQRYEGEQRRQGLDLFEKLLELNVSGVKDALNELDGRPIATVVKPKRWHRRK